MGPDKLRSQFIWIYTVFKYAFSTFLFSFQGHNVLFYCIEHDVSADLFEEILRRCSAYVLTHKIQVRSIQDNILIRAKEHLESLPENIFGLRLIQFTWAEVRAEIKKIV